MTGITKKVLDHVAPAPWKSGNLRVGDPNQDGSVTLYLSFTQTPVAVVCPEAGTLDQRRQLAAELAVAPEAFDELDRIVRTIERQAADKGGEFARWVVFELDGFREALHVLEKRRPPAGSWENRRRGPNGPHSEPAFVRVPVSAAVDAAEPPLRPLTSLYELG